jgi:hypothetical protein
VGVGPRYQHRTRCAHFDVGYLGLQGRRISSSGRYEPERIRSVTAGLDSRYRKSSRCRVSSVESRSTKERSASGGSLRLARPSVTSASDYARTVDAFDLEVRKDLDIARPTHPASKPKENALNRSSQIALNLRRHASSYCSDVSELPQIDGKSTG